MENSSGKRIRLGQVFRGDPGRTVIVAYSHGVFSGPLTGMSSLRQIDSTLSQLQAVDAVLLGPAVIPKMAEYLIGKDSPSLFVHLDWKNTGIPFQPSSETVLAPIVSVEDVVRFGGIGVMTYLYYGQDDARFQREEIERNVRIAKDCRRFGIIHMIEPRSAREKTDPDRTMRPEALAAIARIASEIGADIVKTVWPGDSDALEMIVDATICPVVVAGGQKTDPKSVLERASTVVSCGAAGLVFGRNVYQQDSPAAIARALCAVVHAGVSVAAAEHEYIG